MPQATRKKEDTMGDKIIKWIVTVPAIIAGIVLIIIMALTTTDVILRFFLNAPIRGCSEVVQRLIVVAGFLGMGWCAISDQHIKVDLVFSRLPERVQYFLNIFNYLIVAAVSVIITWQSYRQALCVKRMNVESQLLGIPNYPFYIVVSGAYLILLVAVIVRLYDILFRKTAERSA